MFMNKKLHLLLVLLFIIFQVSAQRKKFDIQGKAGARGIMPENTIEGMLKALDLGVTTLEMDAVISKDKKVVLSQEPYFNNEISLMPNGKPISLKDQKKYNIYKMDYERLKRLMWGVKFMDGFQGRLNLKLTNLCLQKPLMQQRLM